MQRGNKGADDFGPRREDRLRELARELEQRHRVRATMIAADLADPAAPSRLARAIADRGLAVDVLVNNAGYGVPDTFLDVDWKVHADFIQVLVTSVAHLSHELLPGMYQRGYGRVVNVASLAGLVPGVAGDTLSNLAIASVAKLVPHPLAMAMIGRGARLTRRA